MNANIERIPGTLRAVGSVDGKIVDSGGRSRSFHVDGVLFYLAPSNIRFDLKALGARQFLFGSNDSDYWVYSKQEDRFECGRYGDPNMADLDMPVHPRDLIDALGLTPIPVPDAGWGSSMFETSGEPVSDRVTACVQRIVEEYQQILFLVRDPLRSATLEKEYWLSRTEPRLVRRVVFRNSDGIVTMSSILDDYRPVPGGTALLPHVMTTQWPQTKGEMRFQVRKWSLQTGIDSKSIQFRTPRECPQTPLDR